MEKKSSMMGTPMAEYAVQMATALARVAGEMPMYSREMDLETVLQNEGIDTDVEPYRTIVDVVAEYEHGSADCPILTELYAIAAADLAICYHLGNRTPGATS
jgi:hypothetical protein